MRAMTNKKKGPSSATSKVLSRALCSVEAIEPRLMMSVTALAKPTISYTAETGAAFGANSYMAVEAATHGTGSYGFLSWGFVEVPTTAVATGASNLNNFSFQLYNTSTSGNYAPYAGNFSIYVIPNDTVDSSTIRFKSGTGITSVGTASGDSSTLGIPVASAAAYKIGSYSITTALPLGYSTYSATGASMGASAKSTILTDINNGTPIRLAVVADDTGFAADWEGNFSSNYPLTTVDVVDAPKVSLSAPTYAVTETDRVPTNSTTATVTIARTANPSTTTTVNWAAGTPTNATLTGATSGTVTFNPGDTSKTFNVSFKNITSTTNTGSVPITITSGSGNAIAPVFPTGGNTATITDTYLEGSNIHFDTGSYTVNENAGTATFHLVRDFAAGTTTGTATATFSTANGVPYASNVQDPQDAQAGRDYTAKSVTVTFTGTQTTQDVTVPLTNLKTFAGTRHFSVSLTAPGANTTVLGVSQADEAITDNAVTATNGVDTPVVGTADINGGFGSSGVETSGPYTTDGYIALVSTPHGSFGYSTFPEIEFPAPTGYTISNVDSVKLSIYNTATDGGYGGTAGSFDVYALTDDSVAATSLRYSSTGATGAAVIGTTASPVLIGSAYFPNNQVGYNDFTFDNIPASVTNAIKGEATGGKAVRFAIVPSSGSPVAADWEGNYVANAPQLTLLVEKAASTGLPAWLDPTSSATFNASTHALTITGAAKIIADPGTDAPVITANGAVAQLKIQPTVNDIDVHVGGITLTGGAGVDVVSVGGTRSHSNHNVLVIKSGGAFSVDSTSKLNLEDNDLIVHNGSIASVRALAATGRHGTPDGVLDGAWDGNGLTSSSAKTVDANVGYEQNALGVVLNGELPLGSYASWKVGSATEALTDSDVIVKYTYVGDNTLSGAVDSNAATVFLTNYNSGSGFHWSDGDTNLDGKIDSNDATAFLTLFGNGTGGIHGAPL